MSPRRVRLARLEIVLLRRTAYFALGLSMIATAFSVGLVLAHLFAWATGWSIEHLTVGKVIGIDSWWLAVPIYIVGPVVALILFYTFWGLWWMSVRKDIGMTPRET